MHHGKLQRALCLLLGLITWHCQGFTARYWPSVSVRASTKIRQQLRPSPIDDNESNLANIVVRRGDDSEANSMTMVKISVALGVALLVCGSSLSASAMVGDALLCDETLSTVVVSATSGPTLQEPILETLKSTLVLVATTDNDAVVGVSTGAAATDLPEQSLAAQAGLAFFLTYVGVSMLAGFKELFTRIQKFMQKDE